jgi:hypothetical protein
MSRSAVEMDVHTFFTEVGRLSPLRVISQSGPSTFEAICTLEGFHPHGDYLNAITPSYHWHLHVGRPIHVTSRDEIHQRSGRRVLFFVLRDHEDRPFLRIYVHRERGAEYEPGRVEGFATLHREIADGAILVRAREGEG